MINSQKEGDILVSLTGSSGTLLPGKVFIALDEKTGPGISLTLSQEDAKVTFKSDAIGSVTGDQLFDFAFSGLAENEAVMKQAAGSDASSFTFAFAHNGSLPGYAQFSIRTNLASGMKVNVYKYDAGAKQFSMIASGVQVAENGIVTYLNNATSEYLITNATLEGASLTDAYT